MIFGKSAITRIQATIVVVVVILAVIGAVYLTGNLPTGPSQLPPIKIGWISHFTGPFKTTSDDNLVAAQIALDEINLKGGVLGRNLTLVIKDDQFNPSMSATLASQLDTQDNVVAISGPYGSDQTLAVRGYVETRHIPFVIPGDGIPQLITNGTRYTLRVLPSATVYGAAVAKYMTDQKPNAKIALITAEIAFYPAIRTGLIWYLQNSGKGTVVFDQTIPSTQTDFGVVVEQLKALSPDYIHIGLITPADVNFINRAITAGFRTDQIIDDQYQFVPASQRALGSASIGLLAPSFYDQSLRSVTQTAGTFADKFLALRGRYPGWSTAASYTAIYVLAAAINAAGAVDRDKVNTAMHQIALTYPATGNQLRFDQD